MRLMMIAAIFLFIIPLAFGMMLFTRYKKSAIIMMLLPIFITLITSGQWVYEWNHHFVSSTDLTNEEVDGLSLHDELDQTIKGMYGEFEKVDNIYAKDSLSFDQLVIGTDLDDEIIYLGTQDPDIQLTKDSSVGDPLKDMVEVYGEDYYVDKDDSIIYIDRKAKEQLQFWYADDKVVQILLKKL